MNLRRNYWLLFWALALLVSSDRVVFAQREFVTYSGNPILQPTEPWEGDEIRCPFIIRDSEVYKMWYSGQISAGLPEDLTRIGYATSEDGVNWNKLISNPVLDVGGSDTWEEHGVDDPTVILDGSTYKMWYTGVTYDLDTEEETACIGYATSSDGITWTKWSGNPVLQPGAVGAWDDQYIDDATVIKDGSVFRMWYKAFSTNDPNDRVGYATSSNGISWDKYPAPVIEHGQEPDVIKDSENYKMWFHRSGEGILYATSIDGIVWDEHPDSVLNSGSDPSVIKDSEIYKMWYSGNGIGYASSCIVNFEHFAELALYYLDDVDLEDVKELAYWWLSACPPDWP